MSVALIVCVPLVANVTENFCWSCASTAGAGNTAALSLHESRTDPAELVATLWYPAWARQWPHRRVHVARRLLVVQGVHDVTGDMIVAGNQVDVALGDDVRGDRPVPNCREIIGRVIGGAASSRVGKHETDPLRTR